MGRLQTEITKRKISAKYKERIAKGWISPWKGKNHSQETKLKMCKNHVDVSGEKNPMFGKKPGRKNQWGINNPNWKNGIGGYRKRALKKYGYKCKDCRIENSKLLLVHHINKDRKNNKLKNLIILCRNCHYLKHLGDYGY